MSTTSAAHDAAHDAFYFFYRCQRCMRVITKLEMLAWRASNGGFGSARVCQCGSGRVSPTNPVGMEWLAPRVAKTRLAIYASPPHTSIFARAFSVLWRVLSGVVILPPPPPPTEEEEEFARTAMLKNLMDEQLSRIADKLKDESIPLDEALVRYPDEEAGR